MTCFEAIEESGKRVGVVAIHSSEISTTCHIGSAIVVGQAGVDAILDVLGLQLISSVPPQRS